MKTKLGVIQLLRDIDCVKDRLASYYYWDDLEAFDQAIEVCKERNIDIKELEKWSKIEGFVEKFQKFKIQCLRV